MQIGANLHAQMAKKPMHKGASFQFLFQWIHYCHSSKSTEKETGKTHLCAMVARSVFKVHVPGFNLLTNLLKFRYSEKATKISLIFHFLFDIT